MARRVVGNGKAATQKGEKSAPPTRASHLNLADLYRITAKSVDPSSVYPEWRNGVLSRVRVEHRSPEEWADYLEKLSK